MKKVFRLNVVLLMLICCYLITFTMFAQTVEHRQKNKLAHHEINTEKYVPVNQNDLARSPGYRSFGDNGFTVQVNIDSNGLNIVGDAANEPSIAISPVDPNKIVIGWRQFDTISNSFRQAGYAYSSDGGHTWTFPGVIEPGIFRSDPVLDSDAQGTFYYNSLTSQMGDYWCDVFKSTDGGATWDLGTFAQGGDKQWMVIDKTNGSGSGHIYAFWTYLYSICSPGFFTRSSDGGFSYESCTTIQGSPYWGTLAVGRTGDLYAAGVESSGFQVCKSSNALDSSQTVTWDYSTPVDLDGDALGWIGPNPSGLAGQTWIAVDTTSGSTSNNIYVLCSVERSSNQDPLDVMFSRSTNDGLNWSSPIKINDDLTETEWQWFGTMSVAPNGRIDVVWLDTRDNPGTYLSSLYYSYSEDGGVTWSQNSRMSDAFDPHLGWPQQQKMGDYFHMISNDDGVHLAWANTINGEQDVYYTFIASPVTSIDESITAVQQAKFELLPNYPNPFNPKTTIRYNINKEGFVSIKVFSILGQEISTLINKHHSPGSHEVVFDGSEFASGVYYYRMQIDNQFVDMKKLLLLK